MVFPSRGVSAEKADAPLAARGKIIVSGCRKCRNIRLCENQWEVMGKQQMVMLQWNLDQSFPLANDFNEFGLEQTTTKLFPLKEWDFEFISKRNFRVLNWGISIYLLLLAVIRFGKSRLWRNLYFNIFPQYLLYPRCIKLIYWIYNILEIS